MWKQIEATPPHLTYIILSAFLLIYALFSVFIRNRLHLSEPPLALLTGVAVGPYGAGAFDPHSWGFEDDLVQEFTRLIVGLQVFVVGIELPSGYVRKEWRSLLWMLGPVMAFGWLVCAGFIIAIFQTDLPTALVISACLTPTDPVLAASVLSNSQFSGRVPKRVKTLLSCESGCNDGVSFPFLYIGLAILTKGTAAGSFKEWFFVTILWQCIFGSCIGSIIGLAANWVLRFADNNKLIGPSSFVVFYLLLAVFAVGVGSTLGLDDFLVAFWAGAVFAHDGWFHKRTRESKLNNILDLLLNSAFFVFVGAMMPWNKFLPSEHTPRITPGRLVALLVLILCFRRIPIVVALKRFIPNIKTYKEALFCGHFGPMGVGALFLAIEARAQLETGTSLPLPSPDPNSKHIRAIELVWPVVSFIVLGSTMVHGLSVAVSSIILHYTREKKDRANILGGETEPIGGMVHEDEQANSEDDEEEDDGWDERRTRLALPS